MKKLATLFLTICLLLVSVTTAYGAEEEWDWRPLDNSISLYFHGYKVSGGVSPQVVGDTVMVPLHAVSLLMGADCNWNSQDRVFTIDLRGVSVDIPAGGNSIRREHRGNTVEIPASVPPKHYAEEMLVPLETVRACIGLDATYDSKTKRVSLGAYDQEVPQREGWRRLMSHEYSGQYDILFYLEGTGTNLKYKTEIVPLQTGWLGEKLTYPDQSGTSVTKTRQNWYQYFGTVDEEGVGMNTLYQRYGDFYTKWRDFYRSPNPQRVAQDYLDQMYGPMQDDEEEDSSWCLVAFFEIDGGYYTGLNEDIVDEQDRYDRFW